jgi:hypothetical protein
MAIGVVLGMVLMVIILWDTFETIVLPRTVTRKWRFATLFFRAFWASWQRLISPIPKPSLREVMLSAFGPLSLLMLLVVWALCLVLSFGLINWGLGSHLYTDHLSHGFWTDVYLSGTTFFTLGIGDVTPATTIGRALAVCEAGVGFGFLGVVIGYLPVLYQSFSRREAGISLMDARAGSPPTPSEMLRRHAEAGVMEALVEQLHVWEEWVADMMESTLSYPILAFYRSQHDRESWLSSLITILDTCALIEVCLDSTGPNEAAWHKPLRWQAHMTFAMARHAVVDIALIMKCPPRYCPDDRLPAADLHKIEERLRAHGVTLCATPDEDNKLRTLRSEYEPFVYSLAERLLLTLPTWLPPDDGKGDNWQRSAWKNQDHFA